MASDIEGKSQSLLPGIPNEVTLDKITPKMSWRDLFMLSSVSRAWRHANRSRQVYNARLHQDSLETLVLIDYVHQKSLGTSTSSRQSRTVQSEGRSSKKKSSTRGKGASRSAGDRGRRYQAADIASSSCNSVALYSTRDNSFYELPPIPNVAGGFPKSCRFVSLDGKVYVLGGRPSGSCEVYVLDLVVRGQWRRCANMIQPRVKIDCVVMDGKIYVFGVNFRLGSEVYDPKEDSWSRIGWTAISLRFPHRVEIVGEELVLYDGISFIRGGLIDDSRDNGLDHVWRNLAAAIEVDLANIMRLENEGIQFHVQETSFFFMAQGKLHRMRRLRSMNLFRIEVHTADENTWTDLHSFAFDAIGPFDCIFVKPMAVLALNDELLTVVFWLTRQGGTGLCLLQSEGLGSMTNEICWQKAFERTFSLKDTDTKTSFFRRNICMCALQL